MSVSSTITSRYTANFAPSKPSRGEINSASGTPSSRFNRALATILKFSNKARGFLTRRKISDEFANVFKKILVKAKINNATAAPKSFLKGLSEEEMEVLRRVHSLVEYLHIHSLTQEDETHLLTQLEAEQEINHTAMARVGTADSIVFPPHNAPESFKMAWESVTEGMAFQEIPTDMVSAISLANMHYDNDSGQLVTLRPDDPNWYDPYVDPAYDYEGAINHSIISLKFDFENDRISEDVFENDARFYNQLLKAMG